MELRAFQISANTQDGEPTYSVVIGIEGKETELESTATFTKEVCMGLFDLTSDEFDNIACEYTGEEKPVIKRHDYEDDETDRPEGEGWELTDASTGVRQWGRKVGHDTYEYVQDGIEQRVINLWKFSEEIQEEAVNAFGYTLVGKEGEENILVTYAENDYWEQIVAECLFELEYKEDLKLRDTFQSDDEKYKEMNGKPFIIINHSYGRKEFNEPDTYLVKVGNQWVSCVPPETVYILKLIW